jgi:hypothetical protein
MPDPRTLLFVLPLLVPPSLAAEPAPRLLDDLRAVKAQGVGSPAARAAWNRAVEKGPAVLPNLLKAMDTPDTVVANWLRTAFDRIVAEEMERGGKGIDTKALLEFVNDPRRQGRARRLALEVVEKLRPGTSARLARGWLGDPEFSYDAVAQILDNLDRDKGVAKEKAVAALKRAFPATRDLAQAREVARRLKGLGVEVSVADHMGFLRDWYVIGPFDSGGQKGFARAYPPEKGVDLKEELPGKDGAKLRWKRFTVAETPTGRFPILVNLREPLGDANDAVAYAYTEFTVPKGKKKAPTVEFRGAGDDNLSVWVNGKKAFAFEEYQNGVRLDRHRFRVQLREGVNTVLVKVVQAPLDPVNPAPNWEFLLRITDLEGKGIVFPSALPAK